MATLQLLICGPLIVAAAGAAFADRASVATPRIATTAGADTTLSVGRVSLHRCDTGAPWCGTVVRPLDPTGLIPGTVAIYFEYYPRTVPEPAAGTLVATEGGPGYPATESRADYLALFEPLRPTHDVLIMDNRGTGRSGALDCEPLQHAVAVTVADIGACGRSLGPTAPMYSSALAADDLAAVLDALAIRRIDLYGDSYGTYFAQVFALRHPDRLRSLVLDGAYALDGPDYAWYPHYAPAMRDKFNRACERAPECRAVAGSSIEHIAAALERLRARPFSARVRYGDGRSIRFTANASALAIVMFGGSPAHATVRETDAAARAFMQGDRLPLLRLMAEAIISVDSRDATRSPMQYSAGLAAAVFCQDPPQIFDMNLTPAQRMAARDREFARRTAELTVLYAPFTLDEYRGMTPDYEFIDECVQWPEPPAGSPALPLVSNSAPYPDTPVLVISGELDNMTSVADGAAAAARFPRGHQVIVANSFHVNALPHARSDCAAGLVRQFIEQLEIGDDGCAGAVPAVPLVSRFARHLRELDPAHALAGNQAGDAQLRAVSAALATCEDAIVRVEENGPGTGIGLRGGTFIAVAAPSGYRLLLRRVHWTEDMSVSGSIDWPGRSGLVHAELEVRDPQGARGTLQLQWPEGVGDGVAMASGTLGGRTVVAAAPAP
jgi:pimeloyl-ACP methyl ester carboxylesterase